MVRTQLLVIALLVSACSAGAATTSSPPAIATVSTAAATSATDVEATPVGRRSHAMTALGDGRLLVVAGRTVAGNSDVWLGDTWIFDTRTEEWSAAGTIPARGQHAIAHDPGSDTTLLFGGYVGGTAVYGDTWAWHQDGWRRLGPQTTVPGRTGSALAFDAQSRKFVLFGGAERPFDAELPSNDTWIFDPTTSNWRQMAPPESPRPRSEGHPTLFELAMVYHDTADRMILLIGGEETWAYDLEGDRWEPRTGPGLEADFMVAAAYHATLDRVIVYGGAPTGRTTETWSYDYDADRWEEIVTSTSPGPVGDHAMTYDPATDAVYLYGGSADLLPLGPAPQPFTAMWAFDGSDWTLIHD